MQMVTEIVETSSCLERLIVRFTLSEVKEGKALLAALADQGPTTLRHIDCSGGVSSAGAEVPTRWF